MPFEDRTRQVIEIPVADSTTIALTLRLGFIPAVLDHRIRITVRTTHTLGPAQLTYGLKTLGIIDHCPNIQYIFSLVLPRFHSRLSG